jgi:hypothetical protein
MGAAVTPETFQVNCVLHAPHAIFSDPIAGLICPFVDSEALATVLEHLGHEGKSFTRRVTIEGGQDFRSTPYFDEGSHAKI